MIRLFNIVIHIDINEIVRYMHKEIYRYLTYNL